MFVASIYWTLQTREVAEVSGKSSEMISYFILL